VRIAIAGISVENLAQSPLLTGIEYMQIYRGNDLLTRNVWLIRGMVARLQEADSVEISPLLWATALPGGPLTRENYEDIKQETLELLTMQGPFDGVLLANHGALETNGMSLSADTDFITSVRETIGPETPLGIAFDLHGNLTPEIARAGTVFSALRTAPHRDDHDTGYRVADQLLATIKRKLHPHTALIRIPILVIGEMAMTQYDPMKSLYGLLPEIDGQPGVMQTILMVGFAFNDKPWTSMSVMVTVEDDPEHAQQIAADLADKVWASRHAITYNVETATVKEGLTRAVESRTTPIYLSDSGDNTTAGAPGDLTIVLMQAVKMQIEDAVFPGITAPEILKQCHRAGVGAEVQLTLGREHISAPREEMIVTATVIGVGESLQLQGFQPYRTDEGPWACVRIGSVFATFHKLPIGITTTSHFTSMGLDPTAHRIYVIKVGYLHPQLEGIPNRHIMLFSPGLTPLDLHEIPWQTVPRPIFPLDPDMTWQA
jgi:microcystin degradation protein MlrC